MKIRLATTTQSLRNTVVSKRWTETNKNSNNLFSFFMTFIYFQVYNYLSFDLL